MERLGKYIRPFTFYILLTMLIKLLGAALELLIPYLMEILLDEKVPAGELAQIYLYGGYMLLCALGCLGSNILANRMSAISSGRITKALRHDLFEKLQSLSSRQMDELTVPSAESRLTSDTYNVNQLLARIQRLGIRAPILLLGGIFMTMSMDVPLAMILVGMLPVIALVVFFVTKASVPLYTRQQTVLDRVVRTVQENITGIRVIKALSKTDYEKQRFEQVNSQLNQVEVKAGIITAITNPVCSVALNLGLTLVVVLGAIRVNEGQVQSGVIVAFLQYFTMIINAMLGITRIFVMWSKGQASANRVADVLALEEDLQLQPVQAEAEDGPAHIEFRNVSFGYSGRANVLQNLSFRLEKGQTLGILGPIGCGKSTVIKLLLRLYDPDAGQILIDGQDIRTIDRKTLCEKFGTVFQNDFLTEGTVEKNIRFFRDISDEAVVQAIQAAQAQFIYEREGAVQAEVSVRANNLSGGQKQRLLIARALAAQPEILILDDAASALDYKTEAQLRKALKQTYHGTTVLVGQRVSTLKHAELILMMDDAQVIGAGTHRQLMDSCPSYRKIALAQMGDGREGS